MKKALLITAGLIPGDAIELYSRTAGIRIKHYAIFIGYFNGSPEFVANFGHTAQKIDQSRFNEFENLTFSKVISFPGSPSLRQQAVNKALSMVNKHKYRLLANNCEHFLNEIHGHKPQSKQVVNLGLAMSAAGAFVVSTSNSNKTLRNLGIAALVSGMVLTAVGKRPIRTEITDSNRKFDLPPVPVI
mgnify:CR=1 FL=1